MQGTPRAIPVTWRFRDPLRSDIPAASPRHLPRNPGRGPPAGGTGSPRRKKSPTLTFSCWLPISLAHPLLCSALLGVVAGGSRAYPPRAERWRRPRRPWPSSAPTNSASSSTPPSSAPAPASAASSPRSVPAHLIAAFPLFLHQRMSLRFSGMIKRGYLVTHAQADRSASAALAELSGLLRCASPAEAARGEPELSSSSTGPFQFEIEAGRRVVCRMNGD